METTITASLFRSTADDAVLFTDAIEIDRDRVLNFKFLSPVAEDLQVLDWLFAATNAPDELLCDEQRWVCKSFYEAKEYAISVGDVIQLGKNFYMCAKIGWVKVENFQTSYDLN